jgi:hypothetical protein
MATIGKKGDDRRHGAVKKRAQVYNATTDRFIKVDAETGRFMDVKDDNKPFVGVAGAAAKKKAKKARGKKKASKKTAKKSGTKKRSKKKARKKTR